MILELLFLVVVNEVWGHGRLIEPPSRSTMWRYGYNTERNYNDHELFCGGFTVQWTQNKGKCGVCGDPWHMPEPRDNEAGGKYGKGIIVKKYRSGQVIRVTVQITVNHKGYFEFKVCPTNDALGKAKQKCLDKYPLKVNGTSKSKYVLPDNRARNFSVNLQLPEGLRCSHCVLQWTYTAGNNWGLCPGGKRSATGCGPQETFRGCADVRIEEALSEGVTGNKVNEISPKGGGKARPSDSNPTPSASSSSGVKPAFEKPAKSSWQGKYSSCKAVGVWKKIQGMDNWCFENCSRGYCPAGHCVC